MQTLVFCIPLDFNVYLLLGSIKMHRYRAVPLSSMLSFVVHSINVEKFSYEICKFYKRCSIFLFSKDVLCDEPLFRKFMYVRFEVFAAVLLRIAACGMWYFLVAQEVPDVSKDRSAFIFRARHSSEISGNTRPMT